LARRNADVVEISKRCVFTNSKKGLIDEVALNSGYAPYPDALRSGMQQAEEGSSGSGVGKSLLASTVTRGAGVGAGGADGRSGGVGAGGETLPHRPAPFWIDPGGVCSIDLCWRAC
jgi:hypothetical protein